MNMEEMADPKKSLKERRDEKKEEKLR